LSEVLSISTLQFIASRWCFSDIFSLEQLKPSIFSHINCKKFTHSIKEYCKSEGSIGMLTYLFRKH